MNCSKEKERRVSSESMTALHETQAAFQGEAEKTGLQDEQDVVRIIKELRKEE